MAAMESAAFYEMDIRTLINIGLSYIPEDCAVSRAICAAVATYEQGMTEDETRE